LILWDVGKRKALAIKNDIHKDRIIGVAFSPDGKLLATGSLDGLVKLWDVALLIK
jgi:WD40 repeat protein